MVTTASRQTCPVCDSELGPGVSRCPNCSTDLRLFASTPEIALDFYNEGLDLARSGDRQGALDKMRGALAANPQLVDAHIVIGKLLAQSGQTHDLEQAIASWNRALGLSPTPEQRRTVERCLERAKAKIHEAEGRAEAQRRRIIVASAVGIVALSGLCGVVGYLIRPSRLPVVNVPAEVINRKNTGPPARDPIAAPANPMAAIEQALQRPDITVTRRGGKYALDGVVQTVAEKNLTAAAAAFAARSDQSIIDASGLVVKPNYVSVAPKRVERMLRIFVSKIDRGRADPLWGSVLSVSGGGNGHPLKVTGTCGDPAAKAEVARIVKEIYPSAGRVDASGLLVRRATTRVLEPAWKGTIGDLPPAIRSLVPVRHVPMRIVAAPPKARQGDQIYINLTKSTYTVQPGDTMFGITQKCGRDNAQWQDLWKTNRRTLQKPDSIPAGLVLQLPPGWKNPGQSNDDD